MRSYAILAVAASVAGPAFVSAYPVQFGGIVAREATTQTNVNQHAAPHPNIYNHQPDEHAMHSSAHPHELNSAHEHESGHYEPTEHNAVHPNHAARPYHRNGQHAAAAESHLRTGEHAEKYGAQAGRHSRHRGGRKNHRKHGQNGEARYADRQGMHAHADDRAYAHRQGVHAHADDRAYAHPGVNRDEHRGPYAAHAHEEQHEREHPAAGSTAHRDAEPETHQHAARGKIEKASGLLNHVTNVAYAVQGVHDAWEDLKQHHKRSPMPRVEKKLHKAGKAVGLAADIANAASSVQGAWDSVHNRRGFGDAGDALFEREYELDDLE